MPNWCCNHLVVKGPKKALDAFKATLNTKDTDGNEVPFSFAQTVPPPANMFRGNLGDAERKECEAKGIANWYDWQSENWGVKWDCCEVNLEVNDKSVEVRFDSPWGPPIKWMEKASKVHPKLKFTIAYCEGGMGYYGTTDAKNGVVSETTQDFPAGTYDDDGVMHGKVVKFLEKHGIGSGG